jgi:N-acyl-phosphatidylethanolamine-hydrolysing phospholipase D
MPSTPDFLQSWLFWAALALACGLPACAQNTPAQPHHDADGFHNNYAPTVDRLFSDLLKWKWEAWRKGLPQDPAQPTPVQAPDQALVQANGLLDARHMRPAVTWIGHASTLVQASGLNVLTDPIFSDHAFPVQFAGPKRAQSPGVALADLPGVDVVVISHNHYDHLDADSIQALEKRAPGKTLFLVPLGLKVWMESQGVRQVVELDWWQHVRVRRGADGRTQLAQAAPAGTPDDAVAFYLTPVQHWSARSFTDRRQTLWGGWAVFGPGFHWYFSGDTGYSRDFADTRERFAGRYPGGFDLALLPIGAYEPRWFMQQQHMNPADAVQAHIDLGARRSVGIHWGTFSLTDEPLDQPPRDLAAARQARQLADDAFSVLKIGETRLLPRR